MNVKPDYVRAIAQDAIENLDYKYGNMLDLIIASLDTDTLVDMALFCMRMQDDTADLMSEEIDAIHEYAICHGIEG